MSNLIRETSEISRSHNKAEQKINSLSEFIQVEFEGISTKNSGITCLLDRGLFENTIDDFLKLEVLEQIINTEPNMIIKINVAKKIGVPWFFVVYSYKDQNCIVFDLTKTSKLVSRFESFQSFGIWLSGYTDKGSFSDFQESGLPEFDRILRKNGTPWAGNIDGLLFFADDKDIYCIIEYQKTSAKSVRQHENNEWLLPRNGRKGDNKRWSVHDRLSKALGVKTIVIVWSSKEDVIGIKVIDCFSLDQSGLVSHINWGEKSYIQVDHLTAEKLLSILPKN